MRTLLVGDVHGCADPLQALLDAANPDLVVLLGDIFAKGPDPVGVWRIIQAYKARAILGNHDAKLLDVWDQPGESRHHTCARMLPPEARTWINRLPLSLGPEDLGVSGDWIAVHAGVHPTLGLPGTSRKQLLNLRRWPDDADLDNPFWWQLYTGSQIVYYGHDAVRGLNVRDRTVGLDSGCMYGGRLSGIILETGHVLQVPGDPNGKPL